MRGELCASSPPAGIHGYLQEKGLLFVKSAVDFYTCEEWEAPLLGDRPELGVVFRW